MFTTSRLLALAALSSAALASPIDALPELLPRQGAQSCRNQSCEIATIAGSTGATVYTYASYPSGDNNVGDCCIVRYFPAAKNAIYSQRPGLQQFCQVFGGDAPLDSNPPGVTAVTIAPTPAKRQTQATTPCKPNVLIFAKGTFEPGDLVGVACVDEHC